MLRRNCFVTLLAVSFCALASNAGPTILFTNATLHTIGAKTTPQGSLLVRDGRILEVNPPALNKVDQTVDLGGQHLYPGLIAANTVLGLAEIEGVRATVDTSEVGEYTPEVSAWTAVNPDSALIPVARANGIAYAQITPLGGVVSGISAVIQLHGWTIEELTVRRQAGLHLFWPSMAIQPPPREPSSGGARARSPEDQIKERNRKLKQIDDFFLEGESYQRARDAARDPSLPRVPAWEALLPAVRREMPVFIHADEVRQIQAAVEWGVRRKMRLVLTGGRDAWRVAELLATNQVPVVFEHVFTPPHRDQDGYAAHFAAPGVLQRAGVKVCLSEGTDRFGATNLRNLPYVAAQAAAFGMTVDEALRAITLHPAQILGMASEVGTIESGKRATFFAADGDLLDIRTRVQRMWVDGVEVSLKNHHQSLYERYRSRPRREGASGPTGTPR